MSRPPANHLVLGALAAGLLVSPLLDAPAGALPLLPILIAAVLALAVRSRANAGPGPGFRRRGARIGPILVAVALLAGLLIGDARLKAIDANALSGPTGEPVVVRGTIASLPRRSEGEVRVLVNTDAGRVAVAAREPVGDLPLGAELTATGILRSPAPWREDEIRRAGAALELVARRVRLTGVERDGLWGSLDDVRSRAEEALAAGISTEQSALARGLILGQDDRISASTRDEFRDSGLAHLLAVSGQNVVLLAVLTGVLLAIAGIRLRLRLLLIALTIVAYVPIAGAGASIQRAALMAVAGIVATLSSRPTDRVWVILLAATGTLAINPRIAADVGWQLSFVAVIGISLWSGMLRDLLLRGRDPNAQPGRGIADALAITIAATAATAPLLAHHFETLSLASLPANALAAPAVAPVMWLGMIAGLLGQFPGAPLEAATVPMGALISYIDQVAEWLSSPSWASIELSPPSTAATALLYAGLIAAGVVARSAARRRLALAAAPSGVRLVRAMLPLAIALAIVALAPTALGGGAATAPRPADALRLTALDVGQGDAILLEPPQGLPILIDGGNPGSGVVEALEERGIEALAAVVATHGDLDHAGGLYDVLEGFEIGRLIRGVRVPRLEATARSAGIRVLRVAEGTQVRLGRLRLDVLWPPPDAVPGAEPNDVSLTMLAEWRGTTALLTADAEFEAAASQAPPYDVLKLPHHGSADAGLDAALDRSSPAVALISVGVDNSYGHPTPETLAALAEHGVCILRTDLDGDVAVDLSATGVTIPDPDACSTG